MSDWVPQERPQKMPTPPTGISRPRAFDASLNAGSGASLPGPAASAQCGRCGAANPAHMRFCNNCGQPMTQPAIAQAGVQPSLGPQGRSLFSAPPYPPPSAPHCWRCRAVGDPGADFCKFCGARYIDAPATANVSSPPSASPVLSSSVGSALANYAAAQPVPSLAPKISHRPEEILATEAIPAMPAVTRGLLVAILKDGTDGTVFPIEEEQTDVGRLEGHLVLGDDPYLSPRHARILHSGGPTIVVRDLDSLNGVFVRVREPVDLVDGDVILLGQQVFRFEVLPEVEHSLGPAMQRGVLLFGTPDVLRIARLVQQTTEGVGRDVHYLYRDETVIGREQGDVVCTDDPFMSRRHAAIGLERSTRRFVLRDLGSSNGTSIRIRGERTLRPGDQFRVGRHLFRYDRPNERA